ncbi:uncharacterized protein E0L32_007812 [Thyridium curvatum]|uniref:Uncharacterized protein n=1 Tax=Thyridium curvatum TaxID=1093900 RepID=A0A507AUH9_9PEZI|nr:uncharacterized protein E0L32_007812 [Thyridium curvatum]TPX11393.1 hypothetical protein E0L32_007812 [Thyridium curvatum]
MSLATSTDRDIKILEDRVLTLSILLNFEIASHQHTRDALMQMQTRSAEFERLCDLQSAQLGVMNINLTQLETRVDLLKRENGRLNLTLNHLVPARVRTPQTSCTPSGTSPSAEKSPHEEDTEAWAEPEDYSIIDGTSLSSEAV